MTIWLGNLRSRTKTASKFRAPASSGSKPKEIAKRLRKNKFHVSWEMDARNCSYADLCSTGSSGTGNKEGSGWRLKGLTREGIKLGGGRQMDRSDAASNAR